MFLLLCAAVIQVREWVRLYRLMDCKWVRETYHPLILTNHDYGYN